MVIKWFNFWYFFWIFFGLFSYIGLYNLLKNKSDNIKKKVLFLILLYALILHFLKCFIPPYSTDFERLKRDIFFTNICGANIALFPFIFISKNEKVKDYMFYLGVISGILSTLFPLEPLQNTNQLTQWPDTVRFYIHHTILWVVPLLMVTLKVHKLSYKRLLYVPTYFMLVLLFIMLNQVFQSELGFTPLRDDNFFKVNYKDSSMIWAPKIHLIIIDIFIPKLFKTVPVGKYIGQEKYWPWFWLLGPVYFYVTLISFGICMIFDRKNFINDFNKFKDKIKAIIQKIKKYKKKG